MKHVRMFQPRFAALVKAGTKLQTIRRVPKYMPKAGDEISLRMWSGKPYRSNQVVLHEATITSVRKIVIRDNGWWIDNVKLTSLEQMGIAATDGFSTAEELSDWFDSIHGLPFTGIVIRWSFPNNPAMPNPCTCAVEYCGNSPVCELAVDGDWFPVCHSHSVNRLMPRRSLQIGIPAKIPAARSHTRPQTTANELLSSQSRPTNHPENIGVSAKIEGFRPKRRRGGMADTGDLKPL